jgi:hypothetical protein
VKYIHNEFHCRLIEQVTGTLRWRESLGYMAGHCFSRFFEIFAEAGSDQPMKLDAAAGVALSVDIAHAHQAARLRGAVAHLRQTFKRDWDLGSDEIEHQLEQQIIDHLGRKEWEHEHAVGAALTLEEAIALARSIAGTALETTTASA